MGFLICFKYYSKRFNDETKKYKIGFNYIDMICFLYAHYENGTPRKR